MTTPYRHTKDEFLAKHGDCFLFREPMEGCSPEIVVKMQRIKDWLPSDTVIAADDYIRDEDMLPMYYCNNGERIRGFEYAIAKYVHGVLRMIFSGYNVGFELK